MGAWGTAIASDDTVMDVVGTVVDRMKAGADLPTACSAALREFNESLKDPDEGPLVWLALAHVQWKYGSVDPSVLEQVRTDIAAERGLDNWRADLAQLKKRKAALHAFLEKVSSNNPKPSKRPRSVTRLAPFSEGDCISVQTNSGQYTGAIVVGVDNSKVEYGCNLIASLDYLADTPPTLADFESRAWLYKHHGSWNGAQEISWYVAARFRKQRQRFQVVGQTMLRPSDPRSSNSYCSWSALGEQILLCRGKQGDR